MGWNGPITHRQYICWLVWLKNQQNIPTKDNYYQMQIACELRRTVVKNPNKINTEDFKLKFVRKNNKDEEISEEEFKKQVQMTKAIVMSMMTAPITVENEKGETIEIIDPPLVKRQKILEKQKKKQLEIKRRIANTRKNNNNG